VTATGSVSISAIPVLDIRSSDNDSMPVFIEAVDATRLSTGVIAVVDRGANAVIFFDLAGRLINRVGREGDGSGEFRSIAGIGQCSADTLFVWDQRPERMSVLSNTGSSFARFDPSAHRFPGSVPVPLRTPPV
jgi:hypothetical protein